MSEINTWDVIASNNNDAPPNGWPENMNYSEVNNAAREGMSAHARLYADMNATLTTTGASNAYLLASNRTLSAYAPGLGFVFKANHTNTGAATINVSSLGAKDIKNADGSALSADHLVVNRYYSAFYQGTYFVLSPLYSNILGATTMTELRIPDSGGTWLNPTNGFRIQPSGSSVYLDWYEVGAMIFRTNNAVERMRIDSAGNIGIGNNSPLYKLDVDGDMQVGNLIIAKAANNLVLQSRSGQSITFNTGGSTERMRINSAGNVGIGTNNPSKALVINEDDLECVAIIKSGDAGLAGIYFGGQTDEIKGGVIFDNADDSLKLQGHNNTERMRIDSSGRVGIGTAAPTVKLDVSENANAYAALISNTNSSGSSGGLKVVKSDGGAKGLLVDVTGSYGDAASFLGGNVGIGTSSPQKPLHISSGTGNIALRVESADAEAEIEFMDVDTTSTGNSPRVGGIGDSLFLQANGAERMRIAADGNVGIGTTTPADKLELASANSQLRLTDTDDSKYCQFSFSSGKLAIRNNSTSSDDIWFDEDANLSVGTALTPNALAGTSTETGFATGVDGLTVIARSSFAPLFVNRTGTDGEVIAVRKDGTTVGVIGAKNGDLYIGKGAVGLYFEQTGNDRIVPWDTGTNLARDALIDLGSASEQFKDAYISGSVYKDSEDIQTLPQNTKNQTYTFVLADLGKSIYHSNGTAYTWTIPPNGTTAFPIGTAITLINDASAAVDITIARGSGVALILGGDGTDQNCTLGRYGVATIIKVGTDKWYCSGNGVS